MIRVSRRNIGIGESYPVREYLRAPRRSRFSQLSSTISGIVCEMLSVRLFSILFNKYRAHRLILSRIPECFSRYLTRVGTFVSEKSIYLRHPRRVTCVDNDLRLHCLTERICVNSIMERKSLRKRSRMRPKDFLGEDSSLVSRILRTMTAHRFREDPIQYNNIFNDNSYAGESSRAH